MPQFKVRQKLSYYEDFEVEAGSAEEAIDLVNQGDAVGQGPEYLEATATYLTDGVYALKSKDQPVNATVPAD